MRTPVRDGEDASARFTVMYVSGSTCLLEELTLFDILRSLRERLHPTDSDYSND